MTGLQNNSLQKGTVYFITGKIRNEDDKLKSVLSFFEGGHL